MVRPRVRRSKGTKVTIPPSRCGKLGAIQSERPDRRPVKPPAVSAPRYNGPVPYIVRDFQPADFETLWRLDQECFPPGISYSRAELKVYMKRRGSFTLVAENAATSTSSTAVADSGKGVKHSPVPAVGSGKVSVAGLSVAGFTVAEADGRGHGHIITIDVIAAARRSGVGSLLLGAAEARLRAAGCSSVELETAVDNVSALSFYKRHAYSVIKTFPRYYSNGVDALVLQKDLSVP
jgi:[ribosomal protein S18]-alanine N-acetyltransferase